MYDSPLKKTKRLQKKGIFLLHFCEYVVYSCFVMEHFYTIPNSEKRGFQFEPHVFVLHCASIKHYKLR